MNRKHIRFEDLERNEALDEEHLKSCGRRRRESRAYRLYRFHLDHLPRIEPPAHFARTVARLAEERREERRVVPFALFLERAARQLAPGLIALMGAVSVLLYLFSQPVDVGLTPLESLPEEASLEYTVDSLRASSEGGWIIDESN